jgi:hypothetical protein
MSLISQTLNYTRPGTYTFTVPDGVSTLDMYLWGAGGAQAQSGIVRPPPPRVVLPPPPQVVEPRDLDLIPDLGLIPVPMPNSGRIEIITEQVQIGTKRVQVSEKLVKYEFTAEDPFAAVRVQTGSQPVKIGDRPVYENRPILETQIITEVVQVDTGRTQLVQTGTRLEAYTVQVQPRQQIGFSGGFLGGFGGEDRSGPTLLDFVTRTEYREVPILTSVPIIESRTIEKTVTVDTGRTQLVQTGIEPIIVNQPIFEFQPTLKTFTGLRKEPVYEDQPIYEVRTTFIQR